ncbi:MAG: hypothetical protein WEB52_11185 [Dehalococcoidia bacterium]
MSIFRRIFGRGDDDAPKRLPSPDELVLLTRTESEFETTLFRDMLADAGIDAMAKNLDALSVYYRMTPRPWSQELWVLRKDLRSAKEVLEIADEE